MRSILFISAFMATAGVNLVALAQSVVSAGEHNNYSRVVFDNAGDAVTVRQNGRIVRLVGVNPPALYDFQNINVKRKAHRVISAKTVTENGQNAIELRLTCDCTVRTSTLQNGKFVVDVMDASSSAAPKQAATQENDNMLTQRDLISVEEAHNQMVALLKEAAREGLIDIRDDIDNSAPDANAAASAQAATAPEVLAPPEAPPVLTSATTLDSAETAASELKPAPAAIPVTQASAAFEAGESVMACLDDSRFLIDGEALEDEPLVHIADLQAALAEANAENRAQYVEALVSSYLAIGFGDEALSLLKDTGESDTLLADIARTIAERPLDPNGPLMGAENCRGAHALWQAAASEPAEAALFFPHSEDAVSALPTRLKRLLATKLASKMIAANAWDHAEALFAVASEGVEHLGPELEYVRARLEKAKGETAEARDALLEIAAQNNKAADDALLALADSYAQGQTAPHAGFTEDIGALAKVHGSSRAAMAEASSWAGLGNVDAALLILESVAAKSSNDRIAARDMGRTVLKDAFAKTEGKQKVSALDTYVKHRPWLSVSGDDSLRLTAARNAFDFALPNLAYEILDETDGQLDVTVILDKAQAALAAGYANEAISLAAPYASEDGFAEIIAKANIDKGEYPAALAATAGIREAEDKKDLTARAAWLARSWQSALSNYQAMDPNKLTTRTALNYALSAYMAQQKNLPAGAEATLAGDNEIVAAGLRALFAEPVQGSALERSRQAVEGTAAEIRMFEEILTNG